MILSCGQCIGCRLEYSRQWAVRSMHEAQLHADNCFITLTYDNDHLPKDSGLDKTHFQKFIKRLRKSCNHKVRYFHCGEYGEQTFRPHYHALLFGHEFKDKELAGESNGIPFYKSQTLNGLWPYGAQNSIGDLTFESAAYVARYAVKKITGSVAPEYYTTVQPTTGEAFQIQPEYCTMSRRPGIGEGWYRKYHADVYPSDQLIVRGNITRPPRYYDKLKEKTASLEAVKQQRKANAKNHKNDNSHARLAVREIVKQAQLQQLKRNLEI